MLLSIFVYCGFGEINKRTPLAGLEMGAQVEDSEKRKKVPIAVFKYGVKMRLSWE